MVRLKWPWIRTVLTSDAPPADDLDKALRPVRFMPKPWLALDVLLEAETAAQASLSERPTPYGHRGTLAMARV